MQASSNNVAQIPDSAGLEAKLKSMRPQERVVTLFDVMVQAPLQTLGPVKRFLAEQAYDAFAPAIREEVLSWDDKKTLEWLTTTKAVMDKFTAIISDGLQPAGGDLIGGPEQS